MKQRTAQGILAKITMGISIVLCILGISGFVTATAAWHVRLAVLTTIVGAVFGLLAIAADPE